MRSPKKATVREYLSPAEDALLLVKQCDKRDCSMPDVQRACSIPGGAPCGLASCPLCRSRCTTEAIAAVTKRYGSGQEIQWFTLTPAIGRVELDEAAGFFVTGFKKQTARKLRQALPNGTEVLGGLDVSVNVHENANKHLQFHYHAFIWPPLSKAVQHACSNLFKHDRQRISRPIQFQTLYPEEVAVKASYTFKWFHQRRSSFDPVVYEDGMRIRPKAKKQQLQAAERVAVHGSLREYKVTSLLFLMGLKRKRSNDPFSVELVRL